MENCDFSYASYISLLNACTANLPLPFSTITSKHIFEVGVPILFGFNVKLFIDLFQWESSLTDYVAELHSSPLQKILTLVQSSVGKFYCNAVILA